MFYNSEKNIFFCIIFFIFVNKTNDYIKNILSIECINQQNIHCNIAKNYIYAHNKFCKVVNFYFHTEVKIKDNKKLVKIDLLMLYNDDNEIEILSHNKILKNQFQWHIKLNNQNPKTIIKKEKKIEDEILFGKNHLPFGDIYTVCFEINIINEKNLIVELIQPNRKINFCI